MYRKYNFFVTTTRQANLLVFRVPTLFVVKPTANVYSKPYIYLCYIFICSEYVRLQAIVARTNVVSIAKKINRSLDQPLGKSFFSRYTRQLQISHLRKRLRERWIRAYASREFFPIGTRHYLETCVCACRQIDCHVTVHAEAENSHSRVYVQFHLAARLCVLSIQFLRQPTTHGAWCRKRKRTYANGAEPGGNYYSKIGLLGNACRRLGATSSPQEVINKTPSALWGGIYHSWLCLFGLACTYCESENV